MLRIILSDCDFGDAANIGADVVRTLESFEVECPRLEKKLRDYKEIKEHNKQNNGVMWWTRSVIGVEIVD